MKGVGVRRATVHMTMIGKRQERPSDRDQHQAGGACSEPATACTPTCNRADEGHAGGANDERRKRLIEGVDELCENIVG